MMVTFYLPPETDYEDYGFGVRSLRHLFPKGIYRKARSWKQARMYFRRAIAQACCAMYYDINFDPNWMVQLG